MHEYTALWPPDGIGEIPRIKDYRFRSDLDVVTWAEHDRTIGWKTWPEVWHVDPDGEFQCYHKGSSLDGLDGVSVPMVHRRLEARLLVPRADSERT